MIRTTLAVLASVASLATSFIARAQAPGAVNVHVDAASAGTPLERVWAYHGYDEVNYTNTPEGEELLRTLAVAHTADVHVRTHFLFNTGDGTPALKWGSTNVYTEDASGSPIYDYALIDSIMDATVGAGVFPLVELGFMPEALSTGPAPYRNSGPYVLDGGCFYPPSDYEKWGALVKAWATHVKERYPGAESSWQWELWNEPDIGYWQGTFEEYARLYDYTEAALHAVFPGASLGGPAVAGAGSYYLPQFLEHCATGTNAVSGALGTRLDMVSFHAKGGAGIVNGHVELDLGNQLRLHQTGFDAVRRSGTFASTPIVITEADPDGCAACPASEFPADVYRNSPAYGAYEVAMMKHSLDLAADVGVNLRGVLAWAFTFPGSAYFAGYRVLATNGIHLPVLNAFKLLGSLSGSRMPATSSGARPLDDLLANGVRGEPDVDVLAARDAERVEVLVWNYHDELLDADPVQVTLEVALPPAFGSRVAVRHERVDDSHGNAHAVWQALGSPAAPSSAERAELERAMVPAVLEAGRTANVTNGTVTLSFELPRFGLSLVTLTRAEELAGPHSTPEDSGCACEVRSAPRAAWPLASALVLVLASLRRRRRAS